jgi:hypothetical protein
MLVGLLALLLGAAPAAHAPADSVSFHRFSFRYETGWGDCIDTREGTIARDGCSGPPARGRARLSRKDLRRVYDRLVELRAFELPTPQPPLKTGGVTRTVMPSTWTRVELRAGRTVRQFYWQGESPDPLPDEWRRMNAMGNVLGSTLRSLPEYRALPHRVCMRQ